MGSGIVAVGDREAASRFAAEAGGTLHTWDEVLGLARADSLRPR